MRLWPIGLGAGLLVFVATSLRAIEPANVLVLYNAASTEGAQIASYYASVHPEVQTLALTNVSLNEEITADDYLTDIRPQVLDALTASTEVIVTTKGLPLRIVGSSVNPDPGSIFTWKPESSLESELTRIDSIDSTTLMGNQMYWWPDGTNLSRNPYYDTNAGFDRASNGGIRLSTRLDGFTVSDVIGSIDRAQNAFYGPYQFLVDDDPNAPASGVDLMENLVNNVLIPRGQNVTFDETDTFVLDAPGPVLGYVSHGIHGGGALAPSGYLIDDGVDGLMFDAADGAVFHTWESFNAASFEVGGNVSGQGLVAEWIARGGTAGTGHVAEPGANADNVTNEDLLFEMLLDGYTFVEAAWNATRQLSFVNTFVGDPLMVFRELIPGDASKDGLVGSADLALLGANWGMTGEPGGAMWELGDVSGDGLIGSADLAILGGNWGNTANWFGSAAAAGNQPELNPVPEPGTLVLGFSGLLAMLAYASFRRSRV